MHVKINLGTYLINGCTSSQLSNTCKCATSNSLLFKYVLEETPLKQSG